MQGTEAGVQEEALFLKSYMEFEESDVEMVYEGVDGETKTECTKGRCAAWKAEFYI
jgi:hypothetical protein